MLIISDTGRGPARMLSNRSPDLCHELRRKPPWRSPPPRPAVTPAWNGSRRCPPRGGWTTSTTTRNPSVDRTLVNELSTLRFLDDAPTSCSSARPGVGKTMLAVGLARAAIDAGYRTYYTTAADLVAKCCRQPRCLSLVASGSVSLGG